MGSRRHFGQEAIEDKIVRRQGIGNEPLVAADHRQERPGGTGCEAVSIRCTKLQTIRITFNKTPVS